MKLLIVDDDASHLRMLHAVLGRQGYNVDTAQSGERALEKVRHGTYDLVLMDVKMETMDGIEAMKRMITLRPGISIILMTAFGSINAAVDAMKKGARDYITKPIDIDVMISLLGNILSHENTIVSGDSTSIASGNRFYFPGIIGESDAMQTVFEMVSRVAPTDASVLIVGESGTGKELIANAIHAHSHRKKEPFIKVNCASIPETLLESELFGHMKGAFTGAVKERRGRFYMADKGSIFLDEIAEMSMSLQAKLLRVLQEKNFEPLGSGKTIQVDIRVISATNKVLASEIAEKRFREDLFYRLNVVSISLPPLCSRKEDIPLLTRFFIEKYSKVNQRHITGCTDSVKALLEQYSWPGNIRELENVMERAVILTRGPMITPEDLPVSIFPKIQEKKTSSFMAPREISLKEMEKKMILKTLEETGGNRTRTSDILGISRRTLQLKLKKYGVN
ncbi:two-component system, NtrC family, response regulator HydG [Desulfocicer vacuolatum DSM 3385]|uniref:Two-component system, NtrC family, response regulator HydG n=1 Tax=Desulfocicer vacuolatum DSM 3385 TaxID=1121400 RepID=A0A1W2CD96_9BACT|nr:sigma-54 dependent transcriptional regulator [Desulfocicer vacuolatum]SMC82638.1 two-component system, NtrC family, response regulator HydG [Desulfocicer vacuolatum DSM 3385]